MRHGPLVALDIGSTKIACAAGTPREGGGYDLAGLSLVSLEENGAETWSDALALAKAIERALDATGVVAELREAHVALAHPSLRSETVQPRVVLAEEPVAVRPRDVQRLEQAALNQALGLDHEPLFVGRLGFSGQGFEEVQDPVGLPAMRLTGAFHVVSLPIALRRLVQQAVEAAGLVMTRLTYTLPATLSALEDPRARRRALLIDVGGAATGLGLFNQGILAKSASLPWGASVMAYQMAASLRASFEQGAHWVLEGIGGRRPEAVAFIREEWDKLGEEILSILEGEPMPDVIIIGGRAGLMDGFAEFLERTLEVECLIARSPRTQRFGDIARQVGLSPVIGLLNEAAEGNSATVHPAALFSRLISQTKAVLTEYF